MQWFLKLTVYKCHLGSGDFWATLIDIPLEGWEGGGDPGISILSNYHR